MSARWKNFSNNNYYKQMLVRASLVAYYENHGAMQAAIKFGCSLATVYKWKNDPYMVRGGKFYYYKNLIRDCQSYEAHVIFD